MAKRQNQKKPPNGQAQSNSYLLVFDLDDEGQAKAWEVAQQLASQRKLKHVLVSLLVSVHDIQVATGKVVDLVRFTSAFMASLIHDGRGNYRDSSITEETQPEELPNMFAGTADHIDPTEARENFSVGMGNLFDNDDDDDLWDD